MQNKQQQTHIDCRHEGQSAQRMDPAEITLHFFFLIFFPHHIIKTVSFIFVKKSKQTTCVNQHAAITEYYGLFYKDSGSLNTNGFRHCSCFHLRTKMKIPSYLPSTEQKWAVCLGLLRKVPVLRLSCNKMWNLSRDVNNYATHWMFRELLM